MENQAYIFGVFILNGFLIGLLFDIFRILRKAFKTTNFITDLEDILFWIISGIIILYSIFKFNNGELRAYIFIGLIIGVIVYLLLFSKLFIAANVFTINILKKIIYYILIFPIKQIFKFLRKMLLKPISFIFVNLKKNLSELKSKLKKIIKKIKFKKDLG